MTANVTNRDVKHPHADPDAVMENARKLKEDASRAAHDAAEVVRAGIDTVKEKLHEGVDSARDYANEAYSSAERRAQETYQSVKKHGEETVESLEDVIRRHPLAALAVAAGIGVIVGKWVMRHR